MKNSADTYSNTLILKFISGRVRSNTELVGINSFYRKIILSGITLLNYRSESGMAGGRDYWLVSLLGILELVGYPRDVLVTD